MKKVGGEYTTGHRGAKEGSGQVCKWFDDEFSKDATDEATAERQKKAKNARKAALMKLRRAKWTKPR